MTRRPATDHPHVMNAWPRPPKVRCVIRSLSGWSACTRRWYGRWCLAHRPTQASGRVAPERAGTPTRDCPTGPRYEQASVIRRTVSEGSRSRILDGRRNAASSRRRSPDLKHAGVCPPAFLRVGKQHKGVTDTQLSVNQLARRRRDSCLCDFTGVKDLLGERYEAGRTLQDDERIERVAAPRDGPGVECDLIFCHAHMPTRQDRHVGAARWPIPVPTAGPWTNAAKASGSTSRGGGDGLQADQGRPVPSGGPSTRRIWWRSSARAYCSTRASSSNGPSASPRNRHPTRRCPRSPADPRSTGFDYFSPCHAPVGSVAI